MYLLALKMLLGDKGKYISMILGISFSSLIMTQQPSILIGLLSRTYSFVKDISLPDIWVMDPGVQYVEENKPMRDMDLYRIRGIAGVEWAVPLFKGFLRAKLPDGTTKTVDVSGFDDGTLVGAPYRILEGTLSDLRQPNVLFVDKEAADTRLRVKVSETETRPLAIGDVLEINDQRARVTGYVKSTRNFVLQPQVFTTYNHAVNYASSNSRRNLSYVLVKAKPGEDLNALCQRIEAQNGLKAYTQDAFADVNLNYWMKNTGIPINFGISVLLGFIVGAAVVGQTFFNFVQENMKHYAVLKAMGLRNGLLAKMVMLQAATVGAIGYGLGVGAASLFGLKFQDTILAFRMPPILLLYAGVGVLFIILIAAGLSIRRVLRLDPSVIFRG